MGNVERKLKTVSLLVGSFVEAYLSSCEIPFNSFVFPSQLELLQAGYFCNFMLVTPLRDSQMRTNHSFFSSASRRCDAGILCRTSYKLERLIVLLNA